jgi:hypothetical protein
VAALAFSVMIVITRWRHEVSMAPATCLSQAILVAAFLPFPVSPAPIPSSEARRGRSVAQLPRSRAPKAQCN